MEKGMCILWEDVLYDMYGYRSIAWRWWDYPIAYHEK